MGVEMTEDQKIQVRGIFEKFLKSRAETIKKLRFEDLELNPFLIRLIHREMDLTNARSIVEWRVRQYWERGKDLLDDKFLELEQEFLTLYDASGDTMWKEMLRRNS
jgi:hypothetical protein